MGIDEILVMALALPPVGLSVVLWWSTRHAVGQLRESCESAVALAGHGASPAAPRPVTAAFDPSHRAARRGGGTIAG